MGNKKYDNGDRDFGIGILFLSIGFLFIVLFLGLATCNTSIRPIESYKTNYYNSKYKVSSITILNGRYNKFLVKYIDSIGKENELRIRPSEAGDLKTFINKDSVKIHTEVWLNVTHAINSKPDSTFEIINSYNE